MAESEQRKGEPAMPRGLPMLDAPPPRADTGVTLRARNLMKSFGSGEEVTHALQDVTVELRRGQIALLMGPSGSGKSTLLAVLSGLLRPDSGQVVALGEDLWQLSDRAREQFRLRHCGFI